jgi:hypothetical protein
VKYIVRPQPDYHRLRLPKDPRHDCDLGVSLQLVSLVDAEGIDLDVPRLAPPAYLFERLSTGAALVVAYVSEFQQGLM